MFEIANDRQPTQMQRPPKHSPSYLGPERRASSRDSSPWLTHMLDEVDYGMLLVNGHGQVTYLNHAARQELDGTHPLQVCAGALGAQRQQDMAPLFEALAAAQRGLRRLLTLGRADQRVSISVVPLPEGPTALDAGGSVTLLMLGKREFCAQLSVQGYARSQNLTPAETRVLERLCNGVKPTEIAAQAGVQVSTVRTQIGSIRAKTGADSIRDLVRQVAVLPPMVGALRQGAAAAHS
jgi:DNA-binding CsgD family transcriptional regulator